LSTACIQPAYVPNVESSDVFGVAHEELAALVGALLPDEDGVVVGDDEWLELPHAAATSITTASPKTHRDLLQLLFIHSPCLRCVL
jgi:hypothetical protein